MADVDFGKIKLYVGNYDFWYESSQLATQMLKIKIRKKKKKLKNYKTSSLDLVPMLLNLNKQHLVKSY